MSFSKNSVNRVVILGRLGADPEVQYTPTGVAVAKFNVATNRAWKDEAGNVIEKTDWHRIIAWRKQAEIIGEYLKKGAQVYVEGRLETRSWDDQNNQKRYITEVIVENLVLLGKRDDRMGGIPMPTPPPTSGTAATPTATANEPPAATTDSIPPEFASEDDLPF
ncbi:single-stranded DNA-binding protein [candidate division KSB1 bacterium]|nr:single-stranded DNA-binding protein [candidate division KSB1 bacterium]